MLSMTTTLRFANAHDAAALDRLAQLDSAVVPTAPQLVAIEDGQLVAALSARDGAAIADPFTRSAPTPSSCCAAAPASSAAGAARPARQGSSKTAQRSLGE